MRSINTSIVALIPVGAILYVGAVQLGSGSLKDLALALFVGMAAGAYSSIFIATPLLVHLKSARARSTAERAPRGKARRQAADRYAACRRSPRTWVQAGDEPATTTRSTDEHDAPRPAPRRLPRRRSGPAGRARRPQQHRPVNPSSAAGRDQPTRQPRSKRGKK